MERITEQAVREAVAKVGVNLQQGVTIDGERCCPIGALLLATYRDDPTIYPGPESNFVDRCDDPIEAAKTFLGLSEGYAEGFIYGFDDPYDRTALGCSPSLLSGADDGSAIAEAFGLTRPRDDDSR